MKTILVVLLVAAAALTVAAQTPMPKYGVKTTADKHTDFASLKTYEWDNGWRTFDQGIHDRIVAAVDRELAALGFTRVQSSKPDVTVVYTALHRTDVDLKSKSRTAEGRRPSYPVATLVVMLRDPDSLKVLYRGRVDTPIDLDRAKIAEAMDDSIAQMFARYPTRKDAER